VPSPTVHDEFSYLLAADTFAHGRITNAVHPMWEHFETFHEDVFPVYSSIYPPLQGMVLAAGQVITGTAFAGVWLSAGVMCAIFCWALRGWFSPGWALFAGAIAAMRLATFSYWGDSYWGGALSATGGALLFGALPRLLRSSRPRDAALAALGVVMLANSRPFEGLVFSLGVGLVALWQVRKLRLRTILPAACALLVSAGALMAYYNWRVTGSATTLPYMFNRRLYGASPFFLFQPPLPPIQYRHVEMREFYTEVELDVYHLQHTWKGFLRNQLGRLSMWWNFYVGPVLTLPLFALLATWRSRRTWILAFLIVLTAVTSSMATFFSPHYVAPATVVFYAAIVQGMRVLNKSTPSLVRAIPLICLVMIGARVVLAVAASPDLSGLKTWARNSHFPLNREIFVDRILEEEGQHLVLVHYVPGHNTHAEYVYNAADIDGSPIVWAHDMGSEKNAELLRYFASRKVWWLEVGSDARLSEYSPPAR
jgi:4-amino-4-deoxy-L-arabinose transferase-like glycosyltransferase